MVNYLQHSIGYCEIDDALKDEHKIDMDIYELARILSL